MDELTISDLKSAAGVFAKGLSATPIPSLFGVTDGKAIGTYVEQAFHAHLTAKYSYIAGNAASGIDLPMLNVDIKTTSLRQPQSSSPFRDADQKVYGLGHHLLVFVYEKLDDHALRAALLKFPHVIFIARERTADYQTTYGLLEILRRGGNNDDIVAFLEERNLFLDEIGRSNLAERILRQPPGLGYLTVSNALQWRLQYSRVIVLAAKGATEGVENVNV